MLVLKVTGAVGACVAAALVGVVIGMAIVGLFGLR